MREKLSELIIQGATVEKYDVFHETMANELIRILKSKEEDLQKLENKSNGKSGEITKEKTTYGRVAKIIAIYIKTVYVMADPESAISKVAHPPIDSILLKNLKKEGRMNIKVKNWTQFNETQYTNLIKELRQVMDNIPFWKLETFWKAS